MKTAKTFVNQSELQNGIDSCTAYIRQVVDMSKYDDVVLVPILDGAVYFAADLSRELGKFKAHSMKFVTCKSYNGQKQEKKSEVHFPSGMAKKLQGKNIFILDELFDSGKTLHLIKQGVLELLPEEYHDSVNTVTMMLKKRKEPTLYQKPNHWAINVPDVWLYGYGLDLNGKHRNLLCVQGFEK